MIASTDIVQRFETLERYEDFCFRWTKECVRLNPTKKNRMEFARWGRAVKRIKK